MTDSNWILELQRLMYEQNWEAEMYRSLTRHPETFLSYKEQGMTPQEALDEMELDNAINEEE